MNRKIITFARKDRWKVRGKCSPPCEWQVYASKYKDGEDTMQVKTFNNKHSNCRHVYMSHNVNSIWLVHTYVDNIKSNPEWPLSHLEILLEMIIELMCKRYMRE